MHEIVKNFEQEYYCNYRNIENIINIYNDCRTKNSKEFNVNLRVDCRTIQLRANCAIGIDILS